jgi:competence protein ComEA
MRKTLQALVLTLLAATFAIPSFAAEPAAAPSGVVNINTADASQLALLPGIGEKVAQRIVDYRSEHGPFKAIADLEQVKGLGSKAVERLSSHIAVDGTTTLTTKIQSPRKPRAKKPASTTSR